MSNQHASADMYLKFAREAERSAIKAASRDAQESFLSIAAGWRQVFAYLRDRKPVAG